MCQQNFKKIYLQNRQQIKNRNNKKIAPPNLQMTTSMVKEDRSLLQSMLRASIISHVKVKGYQFPMLI